MYVRKNIPPSQELVTKGFYKNTPFPGFSLEIFPRQMPPKYPLSRENWKMHGLPIRLSGVRAGPGRGPAIHPQPILGLQNLECLWYILPFKFQRWYGHKHVPKVLKRSYTCINPPFEQRQKFNKDHDFFSNFQIKCCDFSVTNSDQLTFILLLSLSCYTMISYKTEICTVHGTYFQSINTWVSLLKCSEHRT